MKNVIVNPLGGKAFKLTNPTNVDGLFASSIHNNLLYGGMEFERIGDSVVIKENTITGNNTGIQMSSIDGACQVVIEKNNITSDGGAINISKADQVKIRHNQIEQVNAYTGDSININACVYLGNTPNAEVIGNNITAHGKVAHNIRSNGYRVKIDKNTMRKGTAEMVRIDSSANKNDIGYNNFYIDTNENEIAPSILDNGIGTMGVEKTLTLLNGYSVSDSVNFGQATAEKDSAGNVRLKGTLSVGTRTAGTVICNLPVGFRPTKARYCNVGYYNFTSSKMEVLTFLIEPTGNVSVVYALDTGRIDLDGISFKA
jgi:hypothetical protein